MALVSIQRPESPLSCAREFTIAEALAVKLFVGCKEIIEHSHKYAVS